MDPGATGRAWPPPVLPSAPRNGGHGGAPFREASNTPLPLVAVHHAKTVDHRRPPRTSRSMPVPAVRDEPSAVVELAALAKAQPQTVYRNTMAEPMAFGSSFLSAHERKRRFDFRQVLDLKPRTLAQIAVTAVVGVVVVVVIYMMTGRDAKEARKTAAAPAAPAAKAAPASAPSARGRRGTGPGAVGCRPDFGRSGQRLRSDRRPRRGQDQAGRPPDRQGAAADPQPDRGQPPGRGGVAARLLQQEPDRPGRARQGAARRDEARRHGRDRQVHQRADRRQGHAAGRRREAIDRRHAGRGAARPAQALRRGVPPRRLRCRPRAW